MFPDVFHNEVFREMHYDCDKCFWVNDGKKSFHLHFMFKQSSPFNIVMVKVFLIFHLKSDFSMALDTCQY